FWTGKPTPAESWFRELFAGNLPAEAETTAQEKIPENAQEKAKLDDVMVLLRALREGGNALKNSEIDAGVPVYLLGLAPNASRLAVRFWHSETIGGFFDNLKCHFDDLRMVREFQEGAKTPDREFPGPRMLLRETAREPKDISPLLEGALMRAILNRTPYPDALAAAIVRRIRADRRISYLRAATLKAWWIRKHSTQGKLSVSLDTKRPEPAYRLGRLFAALEKTQQDALGDVNASVRDKFYSAASATPAVVFPRILRNYQHHLGKLSVGARIHRETLIQEIFGDLDAMPNHLNLEDQALFAIGYYHQRKDLFTKKADKPNTTESE
ncbi:MAG: type I-C CRISPR-associated protein Cas8c/Csd1, partial [Gammaproteobacteria bacterium]|nr:type I-C CRISPR-associated protein Cas8c/Csd1 [Gammaproteobacteria bacterium]